MKTKQREECGDLNADSLGTVMSVSENHDFAVVEGEGEDSRGEPSL